jgi:ADP-ribose pyrophosphatase YjhB (NUDIX family)
MQTSPQFPRLGASACVWRQGRVLLVERAKPPANTFALPGGAVEAGETAFEAARRELLEETGIACDLHVLVGLYDVIRRDSQGLVTFHYAIACYAGLARAGEAVAASDARQVVWVRPSELAHYHLAPNVGPAIERARQLLGL